MKHYDLISVGHMTVDLYFKADSFTFEKDRFQLALGGKYFPDEFHIGLGGGATNVAIGAKKCGLKVGLVAKLGNNPFKRVIEHRLRQVQIPTDLCFFENDYVNISAILTKGRGERTIINYEQTGGSMIKKKKDLNRFTRGQALFMGSLIDISIEERFKILEAAKSKHALVVANFGGKDCRRPIKELAVLFPFIDIFIQNTHEFADLIKIPLAKLNLKKSVITQNQYFDRKIVIVTDGKYGSWGYEGSNVYQMKALEPKHIVDTTGAGDGYTAGFIASYVRHQNVFRAMRRGAQYAARKLGHLGAN